MEAAKAARAGGTLEAVKRLAEDVFRRTRVFVTLDTLEFLRRGGRLSRGEAWVGTLLQVKPILEVTHGEVVPIGRVRTRSRAIEDVIARVAALRPLEHLAVIFSTSPDEANYLRERIAALDAEAPVTMGRITPVIGVHGGPGTIGVAVVTAPDDQTRALAAT
jgi:DegV family protein with EDD domain